MVPVGSRAIVALQSGNGTMEMDVALARGVVTIDEVAIEERLVRSV